MSITNSVVAIYDTHEQAEKAIKERRAAGVDMRSLSIAGKDTHKPPGSKRKIAINLSDFLKKQRASLALRRQDDWKQA